jgi:hypothetical protein
MQEKLSKIQEKIESEKKKTHVTQCTTRRSLANLCEFLETYELKVEIESEKKVQEAAVAVEPVLS